MLADYRLTNSNRVFRALTLLRLALVVVLALGIGGCGGDDDGDPTGPSFAGGSATLHAVVCIADHESDIGAAGNVDLANISTWLTRISQNTGMPLNRIVITGTSGNLNRAFVMGTINNLPVGADDVIVFYYSGHGAANEAPGGSRWPIMVFLNEEIVDFAQVSAAVRARGSRFVLTMVDACNNYEWQAKAAPLVPRGRSENYRALFLNQRGRLYMSAASPGEFSLGDSDEGGMFTNQFLQSFYQAVDSGSAGWQAIMQQAARELRGEDEDGVLSVFHPQYELAD